MTASVNTRLSLLEGQVSELRKRVGTVPSQEVAWRMHAAEQEMRVKAELAAALAKDALAENVRAMEDLIAEAEGLVWFLRSGKPLPNA